MNSPENLLGEFILMLEAIFNYFKEDNIEEIKTLYENILITNKLDNTSINFVNDFLKKN